MQIKQGAHLGIGLGIGFLLLVWLQYQLWFDGTGIIDNLKMAQKIEQQKEENDVMAVRNEALAKEIKQFRGSMDSVEAKARKDLGMIKEGETFFIMVEKPEDE